MTEQTGGESDRLAPVTPLFTGRGMPRTRSVPARRGTGPVFREDPEETGDTVAPVVAADEFARRRDERPRGRHATGERAGGARPGGARARDGRPRPVVPWDADAEPCESSAGRRTSRAMREERTPDEARATGERTLLKKLGARSLSVQEARTVLVGEDVPADTADEIIERMRELGYLDDVSLAEQLVHAGVERRGQGRHAIAQTLAKRGVPRDIADAALAELPDDDAERALEFARRKAPTVGGKDPQAALRRLVGQLSRRGYPSGVAMSAARQALDELSGR